MTTLFVSLIDAAIVLGIGLAAVSVMRRRSASLRHAILASAIVCALAMPLLELFLPQVPVIHWGTNETWSSGAALSSDVLRSPFAGTDTPASAAAGLSWMSVLAGVWMSGSLLMATVLGVSFLRLRHLKKRCVPLSGRWRELTDDLRAQCGVRRQVTLLQSTQPLLITCGSLRPVIVLPSEAASWPDERCRAVLRHELAHIRRHDATVQVIGEVLRVVQWMNPLVWLACHRLRQESEYACDDVVLGGGVEPTEYATHLLDVARQLSGRHAKWLSVPAIAHPSTLERRIIAMLQRHRNRAPLARTGWIVAALAAVGVSLPVAAASVRSADDETVVSSPVPDVSLPAPRTVPSVDATRPARAVTPPPRAVPRARQANGSIAGTIVDQTGGTMPGVQVTVSNAAGISVAAQTNERGQFTFRDLAAGEYELVARIAGFGTVTNVVKLAAGANVQGSLTMPLGTLQETITVACAGPSESVHRRFPGNAIFPMSMGRALPVSDGQVRVGGNVRPPAKISDVRPSCPSAPAADTTVDLTARIGPDGTVFDILAVHAPGVQPDKEFIDAAIDAVRRWKFTPTLLNGQTVDVNMKVRVTFVRPE